MGDCSVIISVWWWWRCFNSWWPWDYIDSPRSWGHRRWWGVFSWIHQRLLQEEQTAGFETI